MSDDWHNLGLSSAQSPVLRQALRNAQRDNYFQNLRVALAGQAIVWTGMIGSFHAQGYNPAQLAFMAVFILAALIHQAVEIFIDSARDKLRPASPTDITRIIATAVTASVVFGFTLAALYDPHDADTQALTGVLATGFCAAAIGGMGYIPAAAVAYILLILGPMMVVMASGGTALGRMLCVAAALFILIMIGFVRQTFMSFLRSVHLGVDNLELLQRAEAANRTKSNFLASMNHELRTPLNAISNYSALVREELLEKGDTVAARDLERIQIANRHLVALIGNALDLAKIEAGKLDLELTDFDLDEFLSEVVAITSPLALDNVNQFSVKGTGSLGTIRCDSLRLRQVLINLLGNAFKFTKNGTIELAVSADVAAVEFAVTDSGIGMSADAMGSLFRAYQQADVSIARHYGGSGLGLALTDLIVKAMGGSLTVASQLGHGSRFCVRIGRSPPDKDA